MNYMTVLNMMKEANEAPPMPKKIEQVPMPKVLPKAPAVKPAPVASPPMPKVMPRKPAPKAGTWPKQVYRKGEGRGYRMPETQDGKPISGGIVLDK